MPRKLTMKQAILSKCHDCMGHYSDGKIDCENIKCELYPYMPYRKLEPDFSWLQWHPKSVGFKDADEISKVRRSSWEKSGQKAPFNKKP
jgi:hypothetical protein